MSRQLFQYDPVIGYRFIPGLTARVQHEQGGYLVRANSDGFRCERDFAAAKPPGVRRILLFGDSFTAGDGVAASQRFGDLLEQMIPAAEVYNFGIPGSGTDQHFLLWQEYAPRIEHDLVILSVQAENLRRVAAKYRWYQNEQGNALLYAKPYYEIVDGGLALRNCPPERKPIREEDIPAEERHRIDNCGPRALARKLVNSLGAKELAQKLSHYQPLPEYSDPDHPAWMVMRLLIREWAAREPRPLILAPLPLYHYVEETADAAPYRARFAEAAAESGAILHDPLPDLWRSSKQERRAFRFKTDIHPTVAGHRALAESLAPAVRGVFEQARGVFEQARGVLEQVSEGAPA